MGQSDPAGAGGPGLSVVTPGVTQCLWGTDTPGGFQAPAGAVGRLGGLQGLPRAAEQHGALPAGQGGAIRS